MSCLKKFSRITLKAGILLPITLALGHWPWNVQNQKVSALWCLSVKAKNTLDESKNYHLSTKIPTLSEETSTYEI